MKKNLILCFFSIFLTFTLIEVFLKILGTYSNLTQNKLIHADTIYERPKNSYQKHKHPDVNYIITNYYDDDGVKNNTGILTSKKKNIIGVFGDSFTENVAVDPKFDFVSILNKNISGYTLVNYGVGGYEIDQVFLRYLKYKDHDHKYIFYLFFPGDQNLKNIISFDNEENYIIKKNNINYFYQILGKLNITYFCIDSFYFLRSIFFKNHTRIDKNNYNQILANKIAIYEKRGYQTNIKEFYKILKIFQKTVEKNGSKFFVLVFPDEDNISLFENFIDKQEYKINYFILNNNLNKDSNLRFKNDNHWNEYGNLEFAKNLNNIFFKLKIKSNKVNFSKSEKEIINFYKKYK